MRFRHLSAAIFALAAAGCTHDGALKSAAINDSRYNTNFAELNRLVDELCMQSRLDVDAFSSAAIGRGMEASNQSVAVDGIVLSAFKFRGGSIYLFEDKGTATFPELPPGRKCGVALRTRGTLDFEGEIIAPLTSTLAATNAERTQFHHGSTWLIKRGDEVVGQFLVAGPAPPDISIQIVVFESSTITN